MRTSFALALVAMCATAAMAEDTMIGLAYRPATTTVASGFDTVVVNPSSGSVGTVGTFNVPSGGAVALSSASYDSATGDLYTVQFNNMGTRAYLTANNFGSGARIQCRLDIAPVSIHYEGRDTNGNPTFVGIAYDNSALGKQLQVVRFTREPNTVACKVESLDSTALISTEVSQITAFQNNRLVMLTTTDQSTTVAGTLVTVDVRDGFNRFPLTNKKISFTAQSIGFQSPSNDKDVVIFGTTTDNKRGVWTVDLEDNSSAGISSQTETSALSTNDHSLYNFGVFRNQNNFRFISGTNAGAASIDGFNLAANSGTSVAALSSVVLGRNNVLFTLPVNKAAITRLSGSAESANTVIVRGDNLFGGQSGANVAKCQFVVNGDITTADMFQTAGANTAYCSFGAAPAAGTQVTFSVSTDGVTYSNTVTYTYSCSVSALSFVQTQYEAVSGLAATKAQMPLEVQLRDSNNNQCLFGVAGVSVTLSISATDGSAGSVTGTSTAAASTSGLVTFPSFAITATQASNSNSNYATFTISASTGSASATVSANIRKYASTASTLVGTGFNSDTGKFVRYLLNPTVDTVSPIQVHEYSVASTSTVALGLTAVDRTNNVLYTVETQTAAAVTRIHLVGTALGASTSGNFGGSCVVPDSVTQNSVVGLWHKESTSTSATFLAAVHKPTETGIRLVELNRLFTQASSSDCTLTEVDSLALDTLTLATARYYDGYFAWVNDNAEFPMTENSWYSDASVAGGSLFSLVKLPTGTVNSPDYVPMMEVVREKEIPFTVTDFAPMGNGQFLVSGFTASDAAGTKFLTYQMDASSQDGQIVLLGDGDISQSAVSPFGYALQHNSDPTDFLLHAIHGDDTTQTLSRVSGQNINTISPASVDYTGTSRLNLIDVQAIAEPTITGVALDTSAATVTADNIILTTAFRCRYDGTTVVQPTVGVSAAQVSFPDSVKCDNIPANLLTQSSVSVEISTDGTHFSNAGTLVLSATPTVSAIPANPITNTGLDTARTKAIINRNLPFSTANCAALLATAQTQATAQGLALSGRNECVEIDPTTTATGRLRSLASGTQINLEFETAAAKASFDTFLQSDAGKQWLADNGLEASDITTSVASSTDEDDDLTDGEIAGIVIGSIAGVALIGALIAFALKGSSSSSAAPAAAPAATYAARDTTVGSSYDSTSGSVSYDSTSGSYDSDSGSYDSEDYSDDYSGSSYV